MNQHKLLRRLKAAGVETPKLDKSLFDIPRVMASSDLGKNEPEKQEIPRNAELLLPKWRMRLANLFRKSSSEASTKKKSVRFEDLPDNACPDLDVGDISCFCCTSPGKL